MFISIREYEIIQGDFLVVSEIVDKTFLSLINKIDGFISYYVLKTKDNKLMTLSIFKDEQGMQKTIPIAAKWAEEHSDKFKLLKLSMKEGVSISECHNKTD